MEYKSMLKILMLIPGKFSTLIDRHESAAESNRLSQALRHVGAWVGGLFAIQYRVDEAQQRFVAELIAESPPEPQTLQDEEFFNTTRP